MENTKTHICTPDGVITKLSKFDSIMRISENVIEGYCDYSDGTTDGTILFRGTKEEVADMMENIKEALCIG